MQESLPNTYPLGAANPCPTCPAGFVYLSSNGNSTREAGKSNCAAACSNGLDGDAAVHVFEIHR